MIKVGDKVRVNSESQWYEGKVGVVTEIIPADDPDNINDGTDDVYVNLEEEGETIFAPSMLEVINAPTRENNNHPTLVISAFPGMGKTFLYNNVKNLNIKDSDSSKFSKSGFPRNYIRHIKDVINDNETDVLFVSSHEEVRQALKAENITFCLVIPPSENYEEMIQRYIDRGSPETFVNMMKENFYKFLVSCWEFDSEYNNCFMFKIDKMREDWLNAVYDIFMIKKEW